jgi:hypothetical protein
VGVGVSRLEEECSLKSGGLVGVIAELDLRILEPSVGALSEPPFKGTVYLSTFELEKPREPLFPELVGKILKLLRYFQNL